MKGRDITLLHAKWITLSIEEGIIDCRWARAGAGMPVKRPSQQQGTLEANMKMMEVPWGLEVGWR